MTDERDSIGLEEPPAGNGAVAASAPDWAGMSVAEITRGGPDAIVAALLHGSPLARQDVFELYAALRETAPVYDAGNGLWVLSNFDDVHRSLRHPGTSTAKLIQSDPRFHTSSTLRTFGATMLHFDEPAHSRQRRLVRQAFTLQTVKGLQPFVDELVGRLLDACEEKGEFDFIGDFADQIPVAVICRMLGVPAEDVETFHEWNFTITASSAAAVPDEYMARADEAMDSLRDYMFNLLQERRRNLGEDLLSKLILARDEEDKLDDEEMLSLAILLLAAGSDTTTAFLGAALAALFEFPDQLQQLRDDPGLKADALEELMRYGAPVHFGITRVITEPFQLNEDIAFAAGDRIWTMLAGGNHDPGKFDDPERLDLRRPNVRHLGFAQGIHMCVGAMLARMETGTALMETLNRFPRLELREDHTPWYDHGNLRGVRHLNVAA